MAYAKKTSKASEAFQKLKNDLAAGTAGNAYIFYGEETYLREYYLKELRKKLVPAGFEEFNYHTLEGKDLTVQTLAETAEAMPMMAERTLIVVSDFDLFKLNEEQREKLIAFLEDVPPYCMLAENSCICGPNAIGLRRNGFDGPRRLAIRKAIKEVFFRGLNTANALAAIEAEPETPDVEHFVDFIRHSERGIMPGDPELIALGTHLDGPEE